MTYILGCDRISETVNHAQEMTLERVQEGDMTDFCQMVTDQIKLP